MTDVRLSGGSRRKTKEKFKTQETSRHTKTQLRATLCTSKILLVFLIMIHQVKTKKITTVKEVWIPGLNEHRF